MGVTKIINADGKVKVDFSTEKGSFKLVVDATGINEPSPDLVDAISKMIGIYATRLDLEYKRANLVVTGLETGLDQKGDWYKIHGLYFAHMCEHDLTTPKMREIHKDENEPKIVQTVDGWINLIEEEEREKDVAKDYPEFLTTEELEILGKVLAEAQQFVDGKRYQQMLPFDGDGEESAS